MMNALLKREIDRQIAGAPVPTVATRDHEVIREWAKRCGAEPATGEATASGPATVDVNDGGVGIRFNFPGVARFRPIPWAEWLDNFERHRLVFIFEDTQPNGAYYLLVPEGD
jgi:hypothetical protein